MIYNVMGSMRQGSTAVWPGQGLLSQHIFWTIRKGGFIGTLKEVWSPDTEDNILERSVLRSCGPALPQANSLSALGNVTWKEINRLA